MVWKRFGGITQAGDYALACIVIETVSSMNHRLVAGFQVILERQGIVFPLPITSFTLQFKLTIGSHIFFAQFAKVLASN